MNKLAIIETVRKEKAYLKSHFGVEEIALFGSYAKGDEKPGSDVDLLVSLKKPSYSVLMGLYDYLEKKLKAKIEITRKGPHISDRFLQHISKDLIYV